MKIVNLALPLIATCTVAASSALDPVRVAPHIYDIAFENDRVRVLKATIRSGETPPLHAHPDRVIVYLNPCAWLEEDAEGGSRMQSFKFGEPVWAPAETHGGVTAKVIEECSLLEIELK
ncbi:MAG: cytoplasmic protein [Woeseiaceae bacterium]